MTFATFLERLIATRRRDGRFPSRVDLPAADVAELVAEANSKPQPKRCCCACHLHEVRTTGPMLTIAGVDVYVKEGT